MSRSARRCLLRGAVGLAGCLALLGAAASAHEPGARKGRVDSAGAFEAAVRRAVRRECGHPERLGVLVRSVTVGDTLFAHRPDEKRIPASNAKLLTAAAALATLGPDYAFPTDVYADGPLEGEVLRGNLYLKGYGDPTFVQEKVRELAHELRLRGVRRVTGDLVADDSYFDKKRYGRGWDLGRSIRPYIAPHGALSVNFSLVTVYVEPGPSPGRPARVVLDPPSDFVRLEARVKTSAPRSRRAIRLGRRRRKGGDTILVRGRIPANGRRAEYRVPVSDPTRYAAGVFSAALEEAGIRLEGVVREGRTPPEATLLARQLSRPLGGILRGLNKFSNNFVAEQILKALGAEAQGLPGTAEKGLLAVRDYVVSLGVPAHAFELADGSGLSRMNRITPSGMVTLLEAVYSDFRIRPEFLSSLAVLGVDGTVKKRLRRSSAVRRIRVKTGLLAGVHALSGYAVARNGETLAFSILSNGDACRPRSLTREIAFALVSLDRPVPEALHERLDRSRKVHSRPLPRPTQRDRWRASGRPKNGPKEAAGPVGPGEGIVRFPQEEEATPGAPPAGEGPPPPASPGGEGK